MSKSGDHALTAKQFRAWQAGVGLSVRAAATALQVSPSTVQGYRDNGAPHTIALACAALAVGLPPWGAAHGATLTALGRLYKALQGEDG